MKDKISFSFGRDKFDNAPIQKEVQNFDAFESFILSVRSEAKGKAYFCSSLAKGEHHDPKKFPLEDHYRLGKYALSRGFIALDHDGYENVVTFDKLMQDFRAFRGFAYTTSRHTPNAPRARIVLELSREVSREEGILLGKCIDRMLEAKFGAGAIKSDPTTYRAEQMCYAPVVGATSFSFLGEALDVDSLLQKYQPESTVLTEEVVAPAMTYSRLEEVSLIDVLSKISPFDEQIWFEVCCALARAYGEAGRRYFISFSQGEYWSERYLEFNELEANEKFDRALREIPSKPEGYGVLHLIKLSRIDPEHCRFEEIEKRKALEVSVPENLVLPVVDGRGKPLSVQENLFAVLHHFKVKARYNQIKKRPEIFVPNLACVADEVLNSAYTTVTDLAIKARMSAARVPELLDAIAARNPHCPVQTYIAAVPWDGTERFPQFLGQLHTANPSMTEFLFRKWLIQAVAAVYEPNGIANAGAIILSGAQGIGKTRLFSDLASGIPGVFAEGMTLNPADKDSVLYALTHWIVELGELEATFRKADLAQLKAFITRMVDVIRKPYARKESNLVRRTVFAGTVNDAHCLYDTTGNRRFWPIDVHRIDRDETLNYQQLWAEVYTWYNKGETWFLSDSEKSALELHCESFIVIDPDIEALLSYYPFFGCTVWKEETMTRICEYLEIKNPSRGQMMRIAEAIRKHNGGHASRKSNGLSYHKVPDRIEILKRKNAERKAGRLEFSQENETAKVTAHKV